MTANLTRQRTDLPYLRRRIKPGAEPVRPTTAPSTATGGLRLTRPDATPEKPQYTVPLLTKNITLSDTEPVIRFNARQSAIGSLVIEGAAEFGWEAAGKRGYALARQPDVDPAIPTHAGRPVVQFYKQQIVIGLRHFRTLRRVVVKGGVQFVVATIGGNRILIEPDREGRTVLLFVSRLGNQLELRREVGVDDYGFSQVRPYTGGF